MRTNKLHVWSNRPKWIYYGLACCNAIDQTSGGDQQTLTQVRPDQAREVQAHMQVWWWARVQGDKAADKHTQAHPSNLTDWNSLKWDQADNIEHQYETTFVSGPMLRAEYSKG